jgi:hypothetical protein
MIQSTASTTIQTGSGFENLSRISQQGLKQVDSGSRTGRAVLSSASDSGQVTELTADEQQQVQELKQIDRKVRAHEQAHLAVGADLVRGGPSYSYQIGPDNQRYAVGGEVSIDTSPGRTPEDTIPKAQHIRATALAPVDPSSQDQSVAAQASRMEGEARIAVAVQQREESANADQGNTRLYRSVEQSGGGSAQMGALLDSFA